MKDQPWYKDGLKFKCTGCGECCTGSPGYVWVTVEEIEKLAALLKISPEDFSKRYTRKAGESVSLIEDPNNYDCVFLKDKRCTVYHARPKQCRTFPWWDENLESRESWKQTARRCEGINHPDAPLITLGEIKKGAEEC
jgi:Fe-S-cluster containining protein